MTCRPASPRPSRPGWSFHRLPVHQVGQVLTPDSGFDGVLHFAAKIEVAESVAPPRPVLGRQRRRHDGRAQRGPRGGRAADCCSPRPGRCTTRSASCRCRAAGFSKLDEDAVIRPKNPYAATKLAVDLMLDGECEAFGLGAASLRYFNASGAVLLREGGHLGERHTPESHLIPIVLQVAGGKRDQLMLVRRRLPDPGRHLRPRLHPRRRPGHRAPGRRSRPSHKAATRSTNLGNGDGYSNKQVIETAREVTGRPIPVKLAPRRPGDPRRHGRRKRQGAP